MFYGRPVVNKGHFEVRNLTCFHIKTAMEGFFFFCMGTAHSIFFFFLQQWIKKPTFSRYPVPARGRINELLHHPFGSWHFSSDMFHKAKRLRNKLIPSQLSLPCHYVNSRRFKPSLSCVMYIPSGHRHWFALTPACAASITWTRVLFVSASRRKAVKGCVTSIVHWKYRIQARGLVLEVTPIVFF